jgi:peptide chain release factor subunit 1
MGRTAIGQVSEETIRHLVELAPPPPVASIYIDLDPERFATPPARKSQVVSLLNALEEQAEKSGISAGDRAALEEDLARIRSLFEENEPVALDLDGAKGLAIFAADGGALFEIYKLARSPEPQAVLDTTVYVEPLAEQIAPERWMTLLVSRERARYFRGTGDRLREIYRRDDEDDVHGKHGKGGWSQARYQRSVEKSVKDHLKAVAGDLATFLRVAPFDCLATGAPEETYAAMVEELPSEFQRIFVARVECDVDNATINDVREAIAPVVEERERVEERELLDRLREEAGRQKRAATALDDVLRALNERRVETLLYDPKYRAAGMRCPKCGMLFPAGPGRCPVDDVPLESESNVVDAAIESAANQAASIRAITHFDDLRKTGIAATLRF